MIWCSRREARALGCTHHALFLGLVPGFTNNDLDHFLWVSRSDLLIPLEWAVSLAWSLTRVLFRDGDGVPFFIGAPIKGDAK